MTRNRTNYVRHVGITLNTFNYINLIYFIKYNFNGFGFLMKMFQVSAEGCYRSSDLRSTEFVRSILFTSRYSKTICNYNNIHMKFKYILSYKNKELQIFIVKESRQRKFRHSILFISLNSF